MSKHAVDHDFRPNVKLINTNSNYEHKNVLNFEELGGDFICQAHCKSNKSSVNSLRKRFSALTASRS